MSVGYALGVRGGLSVLAVFRLPDVSRVRAVVGLQRVRLHAVHHDPVHGVFELRRQSVRLGNIALEDGSGELSELQEHRLLPEQVGEGHGGMVGQPLE